MAKVQNPQTSSRFKKVKFSKWIRQILKDEPNPNPTRRRQILAEFNERVKALANVGENKYKDYLRIFANKKVHKYPTKFTPEMKRQSKQFIANQIELIKINRINAGNEAKQRLIGFWSTPKEARASSQDIVQPFHKLSFEERRVKIDQTQKFTKSLDFIEASHSGALGAYWRGHMDEREREAHRKKEGKFYYFPNNWAIKEKKMRPGANNILTDEKPGDAVLCRCHFEYVYSLDDIPNNLKIKQS